jgi:5'-3' exonuclease
VNAAVPTRPLYLVDASLYVFRAWHSIPDEFQDAQGWPTNAVHGFARFLLDLLERERPQHIAIAFDEALDSCFRNRLYPAYKANRAPAPDALRRQFAHCKALCAALGLGVLAHHDYEADDLIGSALQRMRGAGFHGVIVSADKDLSQLLLDGDEQWDYARGQRWGAAGVKARHGVHAQQIADYLALVGDTADGFPGLPGWGAKSAATVLARYGHLEDIPAGADDWDVTVRGAGKLARTLQDNYSDALLFRRIATIEYDAPTVGSIDELEWTGPQPELVELAASVDAPGLAERALEFAGFVVSLELRPSAATAHATQPTSRRTSGTGDPSPSRARTSR